MVKTVVNFEVAPAVRANSLYTVTSLACTSIAYEITSKAKGTEF